MALAALLACAAAEAPPLTNHPGDAARGRALILDLHTSTCLLCHGGPFPEQRFQGTIGPSLSGVGSRLTEGEIRQRLIDPPPGSIMPNFHTTAGLTRVGHAYEGRPVLDDAQIEDLVALLVTLR